MPLITDFLPDLDLLPITTDLLKAGGFVVHEGVARVVLEGSRGLRGGFRPDSDIDLSLIIDPALLPESDPDRADFLNAVIQTTLDGWSGAVELDTAAVFDKGDGCGLRLFALRDYDEAVARECGVDSFGLYKTQKGFNGYVPSNVLDLKKMYPMLTIWQK